MKVKLSNLEIKELIKYNNILETKFLTKEYLNNFIIFGKPLKKIPSKNKKTLLFRLKKLLSNKLKDLKKENNIRIRTKIKFLSKNLLAFYDPKRVEIVFNILCVIFPTEIINYILIHEYLHKEMPNHSKIFNRLLERKTNISKKEAYKIIRTFLIIKEKNEKLKKIFG